jgi:N-methylhydantoinase A
MGGGYAAVDPALRWRPGLGARLRRIAGQPADERPRRRCGRCRVFLRTGRLPRHPDLRYGRHVDGRGPDPGRKRARVRRETIVGDVRVRAPSVDVRTVGAGGGSIAFVPELTKALRVGPESAGAVPGPACYMKGGEEPTVCDANVVLGYLPSDVQLGGKMEINREASEKAVQKVADAMGIGLMEAAEGIIKIVNESMFGALRLVSVEQGYDPRDFALVGFGGAGPLHANALGILTQAWPVIVPPGPGVLCAYGDATTQVQDEAARTYLTMAEELSDEQLLADLRELRERAGESLVADGIPADTHEIVYQADLRYQGQAFQITVDFTEEELQHKGIALLTEPV